MSDLSSVTVSGGDKALDDKKSVAQGAGGEPGRDVPDPLGNPAGGCLKVTYTETNANASSQDKKPGFAYNAYEWDSSASAAIPESRQVTGVSFWVKVPTAEYDSGNGLTGGAAFSLFTSSWTYTSGDWTSTTADTWVKFTQGTGSVALSTEQNHQ